MMYSIAVPNAHQQTARALLGRGGGSCADNWKWRWQSSSRGDITLGLGHCEGLVLHTLHGNLLGVLGMLPCVLLWAGLVAAAALMVIHSPTAQVWQRESALPAVGERFSITQGNKHCASPGSCVWDLLGCLHSCCCKGMSRTWGSWLCSLWKRSVMWQLERFCTPRRDVTLKLSQKRHGLRICLWRRRICLWQ